MILVHNGYIYVMICFIMYDEWIIFWYVWYYIDYFYLVECQRGFVTWKYRCKIISWKLAISKLIASNLLFSQLIHEKLVATFTSTTQNRWGTGCSFVLLDDENMKRQHNRDSLAAVSDISIKIKNEIWFLSLKDREKSMIGLMHYTLSVLIFKSLFLVDWGSY